MTTSGSESALDPSTWREVRRTHILASCAVSEYLRPRKFLNGYRRTQYTSALRFTYNFVGVEFLFVPGVTTQLREHERAAWRQGPWSELQYERPHCRCCLSVQSGLLRWACFLMIERDDPRHNRAISKDNGVDKGPQLLLKQPPFTHSSQKNTPQLSSIENAREIRK